MISEPHTIYEAAVTGTHMPCATGSRHCASVDRPVLAPFFEID